MLRIKNRVLEIPVIQGGMGVGVSLSRLAGAVAKEGGAGIISAAQIGYEEEDFETNTRAANIRALHRHVRIAREISRGRGAVGVNIMVALQQYREYVEESVRCGADLIVSGAGIPGELPGIVQEMGERLQLPQEELPALAPIVSSSRAAELILKMWFKKYRVTPDLLIIEGPKAGGHLGFSREELERLGQAGYDSAYESEIKNMIACKREYEKLGGHSIPVVVGGGILERADMERVMALGADGVQMGSRFVATYECDASEAFKRMYLEADKRDIRIVQSPVGMPGRALCNTFVQRVEREPIRIDRCFRCIKTCNPVKVPYCITQALIDAVRGDVEGGLVFCGESVDQIRDIRSVRDIMAEFA